MKYFRLIAPDWLAQTGKRRVLEGFFSAEQIKKFNSEGYNVYYLPNSVSAENYDPKRTVNGSQIDDFSFVFIDFDLKSNSYNSKDAFIEALASFSIPPTKVIDSGNGVHAYWKIHDLDAQSYLRLSRRLMRKFNTDEAVGQIFQLMRYPGTLNTKKKDAIIECIELYNDSEAIYTCEQLDNALPPLLPEDESYCQVHYNRTYNIDQAVVTINDVLPPKFGKLLRGNGEVKKLFTDTTEDRSKNDYRLGHLLLANDFTKNEAMSVLINTAKAMSRAPIYRANYAQNIVDKIWTFEEKLDATQLSQSVEDILKKSGTTIKGTRFHCHSAVDNTEHGFRLGQVMGLVAGSGVGKTAFALNLFRWFAERNPDYHHFFIPLEQPANEIADRWQTMSGQDTALHKKVHIMSNYDDQGNFRHLSLGEIQEYVQEWQKTTGQKIGCIVIDHIGALKKKSLDDEKQGIIDICHEMKAFAIATSTFLVMQSQTSREKAGIGDLELNKDAAYGTMFFEAYCDYLVTMWQPLKRCHKETACPTVSAFKFCKIRHKKAKRDKIQEDVPYFLFFDSETEVLRGMTQDEITSFNYFLPMATNKRKNDRQTELVSYQSTPVDTPKHYRQEH